MHCNHNEHDIFSFLSPNKKVYELFCVCFFVVCVHASSESASANAENREAYFNGSSYLRLLTPMPMWKHSAFSIRTCRGKWPENKRRRYTDHSLAPKWPGPACFNDPNTQIKYQKKCSKNVQNSQRVIRMSDAINRFHVLWLNLHTAFHIDRSPHCDEFTKIASSCRIHDKNSFTACQLISVHSYPSIHFIFVSLLFALQ